jgi:hypothetical protein
VFAALFVAVLAWWSTILPSHDREWQTDVAVMPRAIVDRDERDLARVRTNFRDEEVFLYRVRITPEATRRLFLVCRARINELADRPEWYHLLSNSCTINIIRYANAAGRTGRLDIRHVRNGLIAGCLYHTGRLDTALPFDALKRRSDITAIARQAGDADDFPQRIRDALPGGPR